MTDAEQRARINNLMAGRRLRALNPGPRSFPEYTGQSTSVYVMQYRLKNLEYACWQSNEIDCATHSPNPNRASVACPTCGGTDHTNPTSRLCPCSAASGM